MDNPANLETATGRLGAVGSLKILAQAGEALASSLDYRETLCNVAEILVPDLADLCIVYVLSGERELTRVAWSHVDPDKRWAVEALCKFPIDLDTEETVSRVMREQKSMVVGEVPPGLLEKLVRDPGRRQLLDALQPGSFLIAPLVVGGRSVGAVNLVHSASARRYSEEDLPLIEEIARRAAFAVDHAMVYGRAQKAEARLDRFVQSGIVGVVLSDFDGHILEANDRFLQLTGYTQEDLQAGSIRWDKMTPPEYAHLNAVAVQQLKETGRSLPFDKDYIRKDGSRAPVSLVSTLLPDNPSRSMTLVIDASERRWFERTQTLLAQASATLSASLDYGTTLQTLARLAVPAFADWCAVDLLRDDDTLDRVAIEHVDPDKVRWAREIQTKYPPDKESKTGLWHVLRTGKPELYPDIPEELLIASARDEEHLEILRQANVRSAIIVPLSSRGQTIGTLSLVSSTPGKYGQRELELFDHIARRAAVAVDNARLFSAAKEELEARRKTEKELRASEERTRLALTAAGMGTWEVNVQTDEAKASPEVGLLYGKPAGYAHRSTAEWLMSVHPEDRKRVAEARRRLFEQGEPYAQEFRVPQEDGSVRWLFSQATLFKHDDGSPWKAVGVVSDVTARKEAEAELRASSERFRLLVESVPEMAWTSTPDGSIDYYSNRWYEYTGRQRGTGGDESWMPLLHPDDAEGTYGAWRRSVETGEPYEVELRLRAAASGEYRWFLARARPLRDANGKIVRWFGVTSDIHEQKRSQRVLEVINRIGVTLAADLDLRRIVQALTDACTEVTGAQFGSFFYTVENEQGEALLIYTLSGAPIEAFERFGLPRATSVFGPTFRNEGIVRSDDITKDRRYGHFGPHHGMPEGHLPVVSYLAVPVVSRSGESIGGLFFGHPEPGRFTEEHERLVASLASQAAVAIDNARMFDQIRRMNEELDLVVQERTTDLQASNDALQGFTYHVSHDLRSPLRGIASTSRIVQEDFGDALPEEAKKLLDSQVHAATKLGRLIDDLLRLSRLSQKELTKMSLDLTALAREAATEAVSEHPASSVQIVVDEGLGVSADPSLLRLALGNLIENAVKYSPRGGAVRVGQRDDGAFFVSDEGIGIDPKYFAKIFEPFQRLHRDDEFAGTGIGLSNVQQVVKRHGGQLWVESELGKGSTFLFTLS